ncbi:MAG: hypothetical protein WAU89_13425 [Candidatus Acidiferrales bacterium]
MADLTAEQLSAAQTMPLSELRELAMKEAEAAVAAAQPVATNEPKTEPVKQARGADGRFTNADEIDNSADPADEVVADDEPTTTIYRKEIDNGNGSIDVYEAESLEELVEKLAAGKLNANKKIQEFIAENKARGAKETQISKDDEYLVQQKLKENPKSTIKEVVAEVIQERLDADARSKAAQERFVTTHADYIANPENGNRLVAWLQSHGHAEITTDGLEKAYQDLKRSGLLALKPAGAGDVADDATADKNQTGSADASTTQQRSPKKGSTVSIRSGHRATTNVNTQPTEDEAYKMPLEELRKLADAQLAKAHNRD